MALSQALKPKTFCLHFYVDLGQRGHIESKAKIVAAARACVQKQAE